MVSTRGQIRGRKSCENKENKSKGPSSFNRKLKKPVACKKSKPKPDVAKEEEPQPSTSQAALPSPPLRRNPRRNNNDKPSEAAAEVSPIKNSSSVPEEEEPESGETEGRNLNGKRKREEDDKPSTSNAEDSHASKSTKQARVDDEGIVVIDLDNLNRYWTPPDYSKPKKLLIRELLRCQLCMKTYSDVASGLKCLQGHGSEVVNFLRCYCCYKVFAGTTALLDHYRDDHSPGIRVETLICPFCPDNVSLPYRNVSTHVVAYHSRDLRKRLAFNPNDKQAKKNSASPTIAVRDLEIMSATTYFHQLSAINPNRFAKCDCAYC